MFADSAQIRVLFTESVQPHTFGSALTVQIPMGIPSTTVTIQAMLSVVRGSGRRLASGVFEVWWGFGIGRMSGQTQMTKTDLCGGPTAGPSQLTLTTPTHLARS